MKLVNNNLKSKFSLLAVACALVASLAQAQSDSVFYRPLTLAPADATSSGGGGARDEKERQAELAKKLQNPIACLINVPLQNHFDWGAGPNVEGFQHTSTTKKTHHET